MSALIALATVTSGIILGFASTIVLAVENSGGGSDIAAYISGGGSAAAVGGLVYMARQILNGNLVSRPTNVVEKELTRIINDCHERESKLQESLVHGHEREKRYDRVIENALKTLGRYEPS